MTDTLANLLGEALEKLHHRVRRREALQLLIGNTFVFTMAGLLIWGGWELFKLFQ